MFESFLDQKSNKVAGHLNANRPGMLSVSAIGHGL